MKVSALFLLSVSIASGFAPQLTPTLSSTQLNLFGGGKKDGDKKGPSMMDQLGMFKKAQEMAQKKAKLDAELAAMEFQGSGADGKVTAKVKFIPVTNPMDPNPEYLPVSFDFDDEWYESASVEDLSAAVKEAMEDGVKAANEAATEKYQSMQADLMSVLGQGGQGGQKS